MTDKIPSQFADVIRKMRDLLTEIKTTYIITAGIISGLVSAMFHVVSKSKENWAYYSPKGFTKAEDIFVNCTTLQRSFGLVIYVKGAPFDGAILVEDSKCENDEYRGRGRVRLENSEQTLSCMGSIAINGKFDVLHLTITDLKPSHETVSCFPPGWDMNVFLVRKEHLASYWMSYLPGG